METLSDAPAVGSPFFSPDGRWVGIVAAAEGQRLRKLALAGGAPATLTTFANSQPSGATWAADDVIYFVSSTAGGIVRVPGEGGDPYSHGMSSSCGAPGLSSSNYDVSPDGQRFLMIQDEDVDKTSSSTLVVVIGFDHDLAARRT